MSNRCLTTHPEDCRPLAFAKLSQSYSSRSERTSSNPINFTRPSTLSNNLVPVVPIHERNSSTLLEIKQRRSNAAADRKNRLITRLVTIVGLLIMILCAAIVALTLKMAPKIDELVRSKNGPYQYVSIISRTTTTSTINETEARR